MRSIVGHVTQPTDTSAALIYFSCLDKCLQLILNQNPRINESFLIIHSCVALKYKEGLSSSMLEDKHFSPHLSSEFCFKKFFHMFSHWPLSCEAPTAMGLVYCLAPATVTWPGLWQWLPAAWKHKPLNLQPLSLWQPSCLLTSFSPSYCPSRKTASPYWVFPLFVTVFATPVCKFGIS